MNDKEKEKFKEHINKFTSSLIIGWQSAISFILPMTETKSKLQNKLLTMFDICHNVIEERKVKNE